MRLTNSIISRGVHTNQNAVMMIIYNTVYVETFTVDSISLLLRVYALTTEL